MIKILLVILLLNVASNAIAESLIVEEHLIESKVLNEEQKVTVYLPPEYKKHPTKDYPVIYVLDGKHYKNWASSLIERYYSDWLIPEMIVVSIDNEDRIRDYTPSPHETGQGGGADKFLQYIEKEILPLIDSTYQTDDFRILQGHSLGGLFTLHVLHNKPKLFTAHFALSPSVHWGNKATVHAVKNYLSSTKELKQFLYTNLGDEDGDMHDGFVELQAFFNEGLPKGFRVKSELLPSLSHGATNVTGMVHALNELYRNWVLPFAAIEQGRDGIAKHFVALSQDLYQTIKPRKSAVSFGAKYVTLGLSKPEKGLDLLKYNAELYPDSADVHLNLAKGYKDNQQLNKAKHEAQLALKYLANDEAELKVQITEFVKGLEQGVNDKPTKPEKD